MQSIVSSHNLGYLETLLAAELEERKLRAIDARIKEAHLPHGKNVGRVRLPPGTAGFGDTDERTGGDGSHIERAEVIVFIGDRRTDKTHLSSALVVAACHHQRKRARFSTAAALVNELVEVKQGGTGRSASAKPGLIPGGASKPSS